jgi:hypothetical protein
MSERNALLEKILTTFRDNEYPGDAFLRGSAEGCEPEDEVGPFRGRANWETIEPAFLDAHASGLTFFSEAGLRYFLPAYLMADVREELKSADPAMLLTLGFSDVETSLKVNGKDFSVRSGKSELLNPRRYGAATFYDYACYRLSVFTCEEAQAIVAYLEYKRDAYPQNPSRMHIETALSTYWLQRAANAPTAATLARHEKARKEFVAALQKAKKVQ